MLGDMLPHLPISPIPIWGPLKIEPFGLLVAIGLVVGHFLALRRAREIGIDVDVLGRGIIWGALSGFLGAHLVAAIFYFPDKLAADPLFLLRIWDGLSSFGGFLGGTLGAAFYYQRIERTAFGPNAEALLFGLLPGWIFGRMGCTLVFDHPGSRTDFFLGMADATHVVRHNLGFYELLFTIALTSAIYAIRRFRPFPYFHVYVAILLYMPVRFALDFLRIEDRRTAGLTAGQFLATALFAAAAVLLLRGFARRKATPSQDAEPNGP